MTNIKGTVFNIVKWLIYALLLVIIFMLFLNFFDSFYKGSKLHVNMTGEGVYEGPVRVYYKDSPDEKFSDEKSVTSDVSLRKGRLRFNDNIRLGADVNDAIRLDLGSSSGAKIVIKELEYRRESGFCNIDLSSVEDNSGNNDVALNVTNNGLAILTTGNDPYIIIDNMSFTPYSTHNRLWAGISALISVFLIYRYVRLKSVYSMALDLYQSRRLILSLAVNDFKTKYAGSYFGIVWAFVQPVCTILVFWFVFQVGFRSTDIGNVPFIIWFIAGLIPWFFFSDAWNNATNCLIEYSYLVKKVVFKVHILPLVKIISNLFVHIFFVCFMLVIYVIYGFKPNIYTIQIFYYSFCMIILVISLSTITAPLMVFFKDLGQIMNIVLQFGMWLTPIMWQIDIIPARFMWIFKLNPMYYIVQGYRDSLIYNVPFYNNIKQTLYFWIIVFACMLLGCIIFRKLRPHFADVL